MPDNTISFAGSVPAFYDRVLVPLIFDPYAADLVVRLKELRPVDVLETAAGTGAVTRAIRAGLPEARITATDLQPAMLQQAQTRPMPGAPVTWQQADAMTLPFADGSFDCVVCQFGVMFFPDRVMGMREARRVLRPGGHFLFDVWDRIEANPMVAVICTAVKSLYDNDPPDFMERIPHGYHDPELIEREVRAAGYANVRVEAITHVARASSAEEAALAWCQGTPMRGEIERRGTPTLAQVTDHVAQVLVSRYGQGPIADEIGAFVVTASG